MSYYNNQESLRLYVRRSRSETQVIAIQNAFFYSYSYQKLTKNLKSSSIKASDCSRFTDVL